MCTSLMYVQMYFCLQTQAILQQHSENRKQEKGSNPGTYVRMCSCFYLMTKCVYIQGFIFHIIVTVYTQCKLFSCWYFKGETKSAFGIRGTVRTDLCTVCIGGDRMRSTNHPGVRSNTGTY